MHNTTRTNKVRNALQDARDARAFMQDYYGRSCLHQAEYTENETRIDRLETIFNRLTVSKAERAARAAAYSEYVERAYQAMRARTFGAVA